ncbi:PREDICTED: olfactory receptor 2T3-like [Chrysochloris asiatica]|uniref:Olfactory receptor n=1 Tax=Chrysochloris asiatica TaxID=185453 RepID=A0A9B0U7G1_CHRAS|nr:PREDICTED: olfactory receptor 2T3-like [Chrysochloris asiatica]
MYSEKQTSENQTSGNYFILTGLFDQTKYAAFLYTLTFVFFLMALIGNAFLILLIQRDPRLHTPMYFFISQLSLIDLLYISVTVPKMLVDQTTGDNTISPLGCGIQMFFYLTLAGAEVLLLTAMAYDRYVAICRPLHYPLLMNQRVCRLFMLGYWFLGFFEGFLLTPMTMSLPFCQFRKIMNFFCEAPAVLKVSCSNVYNYEMFMYLCCVIMLLIPTVIISSSYALILRLIHSMNSAEGRRKAFATCSSHMVVVLLFFGAGIYTYMIPRSYHTGEQDMMVSAFYTIITPVLNPLIYSLRNKDVTGALKKIVPSGERIRKVLNW